MTEIQKLELEVLVKFDEICKKHGLRYYLASGTCLGAVRHKGFIPWDHDIDVFMPIEDALKLEEYQNEFATSYFVESYRTNQSCRYTNMRVQDTAHKTRVFVRNRQIEEANICIDIYFLYNLPENRIAVLFNVWRSHFHKMLIGGVPQNHGMVVKLVSRIILFIFGQGNKEKKIKKIESKLNYKGSSSEMGVYYGLDISFCSVIKYKKEWFSEPQKLIFEGYEFDGPTNPDKYLKQKYGDYMTPPSKETIDNEPRIELI